MEQPTPKQIMFAETLGIDNPSQYDKKTLSGMINAKVGKQEEKPADNKSFAKAETPRERIADTKSTTMYTSYAKDIFIAIYPHAISGTPLSSQAIMNEAIGLVKQARDAFT